MKININNKTTILEPKLEKCSICSYCYFEKNNIDCFQWIYNLLYGCFKNSLYYNESNIYNDIFKL